MMLATGLFEVEEINERTQKKSNTDKRGEGITYLWNRSGNSFSDTYSEKCFSSRAFKNGTNPYK